MTADLLAPLREAPEQSALVLDVDGTLAPIVARPELAEVPTRTRIELERLVDRYRLVACVSGRPGVDAARLVGVDGVRYVGNHGLELLGDAKELSERVAAFRASVDRPVEDKGLTLAYHFRSAPNEAEARRELEAVAGAAANAGLDARWGRKVLEIRPAVDADKGTAVVALLEESGARRGLYAGDDSTDLDAFAGLASAGLEYAVRVAISSDEAPVNLLAQADLVADGPTEFAKLLARL
ncbi:MAG TPA: trehalose-phosphatase [Gaiellaceae bacterium]|jgi:trehalose 6-phosphate phosphatase|nr:trehalose-phosphatase [Gaiellaceae bacterium]